MLTEGRSSDGDGPGVDHSEAGGDECAGVTGCDGELVACGNPGDIDMAKQAGLKPDGGFGLNIYNRAALAEMYDAGLYKTTVSFELSIPRMRDMADARAGFIAYGYLPLMLARLCPLTGNDGCKSCRRENLFITDRMKEKFPVVCHGNYAEILNNRPLYLADKIDEFKGMGFAQLYFTVETKKQTADIVRAYLGENINMPEKFTRGLYFRNIM